MKGSSLWVCAALAVSACVPPAWRDAQPVQATAGAVPHRTATFEGRGGARLFEQSWHASDPRAVLVIHHGLRSYSAHYSEFAAHLAARGVSTYAYDMRGHGRSSGHRATLTGFDDLLDDLEHFIASVRQREPGRPIFLMGHSVGGAVVSLFVAERRPALAGLVVLAPALRIDRSLLELAATPSAGALAPYAGLLDTPNRAFSRDPAVVREMDADPMIYQQNGPAITGVSLLAALARVWSKVDTIDVPVLGVHGTADTLTDPRGTAEFTARVRTTDRRLVLYRGLFHDLIREPERGQVEEDLAGWIDAHIPAR